MKLQILYVKKRWSREFLMSVWCIWVCLWQNKGKSKLVDSEMESLVSAIQIQTGEDEWTREYFVGIVGFSIFLGY